MPRRDEVAEARRAIDEVVERHTGRLPAEVQFRDGERGRVALISILLPADQPLPSAHRRAGASRRRCASAAPSWPTWSWHTEPIVSGLAARRAHGPRGRDG